MREQALIEYPCPECGEDGPHVVVETSEDGVKVAECAGCYCEFNIPARR